MVYVIHYVWNVSSLILCILPILFSTLKLNIEPNFSQFIRRIKIGIFQNWGFLSVGLRLYFQLFPNSKRDFGIFECCSCWTSQFFPVQKKKMEKCFFNTSLGCTSKLFPIHLIVEKDRL